MRGNREQIQLPSGHSFRMLRWSRDLRAAEAVLAPDRAERIAGEGTHWHYHVEMELTLFTAGEGTRFVGDHIGPFAEGDLVLLGQKLPHYWHVRGPSAGLSLQWSFPHGHPFWTFPETLALSTLFRKAGRGIRFTGRTAEALASGMHEMAKTGGTDRLGLLLRLLARMADAPAKEQSFLSVRSFSLPTEATHQSAMAEAVRYVLANFREELRLEALLRLTGMSKPTFSRQFKRHAGKTLSEFLAEIRLQTACRELVETDGAVLEIALASGFTQVSFFNRLFRRVFHCSPTEYRATTRRKRRIAILPAAKTKK